MNSENLKINEVKILSYLLTHLEKQISRLRVSFCGSMDKYCPTSAISSKKMLEFIESEEADVTHNLCPEDYRLMVDSCDIEASLHRIFNELINMKSNQVLKEVLVEFESESTAFNEHKKMLKGKRKQIEQVKEELTGIQEQAQVIVEHVKSKKSEANVTIGTTENSGELSFLKKLMNYRLKSRRNYYGHLKTEIQKNIECYERDSRTQAHADIQMISFWLLKYDTHTENLSMLLRQMFDDWTSKRRDLEILKKFRRLNLQKIQDLQRILAEREDYIEKYRKQKEVEQKEVEQKHEEELRRQTAAVKIQATWRGTMVRKHLGPYKIKTPKKGKGKKGKGTKGKGKKK